MECREMFSDLQKCIAMTVIKLKVLSGFVEIFNASIYAKVKVLYAEMCYA